MLYLDRVLFCTKFCTFNEINKGNSDMKQLLLALIGASCLMLASVASACANADGTACSGSTQSCNCQQHKMAGTPCESVKGGTCHHGTNGCVCKQQKLPGASCENVNGGTCHSGTRGCVCKHDANSN